MSGLDQRQIRSKAVGLPDRVLIQDWGNSPVVAGVLFAKQEGRSQINKAWAFAGFGSRFNMLVRDGVFPADEANPHHVIAKAMFTIAAAESALAGPRDSNDLLRRGERGVKFAIQGQEQVIIEHISAHAPRDPVRLNLDLTVIKARRQIEDFKDSLRRQDL